MTKIFIVPNGRLLHGPRQKLSKTIRIRITEHLLRLALFLDPALVQKYDV
jgi:hypothetical protein